MLTPSERRLLFLLALWIASASVLDLVPTPKPAALARRVGENRWAEVSMAGVEEPDSRVAEAPASFPKSRPAGPESLRYERAPRAPARGRRLAYDRLGRLDLNRADAIELDLLPGVGPALAGRILSERRRVGRFRSPRDLLQVHGIGLKTLAKLLPRVSVDAAKDSLAAPAPAPDSTMRFAR
jgi:hypothetical protein